MERFSAWKAGRHTGMPDDEDSYALDLGDRSSRVVTLGPGTLFPEFHGEMNRGAKFSELTGPDDAKRTGP